MVDRSLQARRVQADPDEEDLAMTIDVSSHRITRYTSQLRRFGANTRWREFVFYDEKGVEVLTVACFMDEEKGVEDLFHERLPPQGFDKPDEEKEQDLSEEPVG